MVYCIRGLVWWIAGLVVVSSAAAQPPTVTPIPARKATGLPAQAKVEKAVSAYLEHLPGRQENDLLSRGDIKKLFDTLSRLGWDVRDQKEIQERLLPDSDWLVRKLRTSKGTRFMRGLSSYPGGYDRLDRMRRLPHGKTQLQGLIDSPGGSKLIEYLTMTKQGRQTGAELTNHRGGGAFNTPTKRLYSKADVFKQLKKSYAAEAARRLKAAGVQLPRSTTTTTKTQPQAKSGLNPDDLKESATPLEE